MVSKSTERKLFSIDGNCQEPKGEHERLRAAVSHVVDSCRTGGGGDDGDGDSRPSLLPAYRYLIIYPVHSRFDTWGCATKNIHWINNSAKTPVPILYMTQIQQTQTKRRILISDTTLLNLLNNISKKKKTPPIKIQDLGTLKNERAHNGIWSNLSTTSQITLQNSLGNWTKCLLGLGQC